MSSPGCIWPLLTVILRFSRSYWIRAIWTLTRWRLGTQQPWILRPNSSILKRCNYCWMIVGELISRCKMGSSFVWCSLMLDPIDHQIIELFNGREFDIFDWRFDRSWDTVSTLHWYLWLLEPISLSYYRVWICLRMMFYCFGERVFGSVDMNTTCKGNHSKYGTFTTVTSELFYLYSSRIWGWGDLLVSFIC